MSRSTHRRWTLAFFLAATMLVLVTGCDDASFNSSNASTKKEPAGKGGSTVIPVGEKTNVNDVVPVGSGKVKEGESSDPDIATFNPDTGEIIGKTPGTTTIDVKYENGTTGKIEVVVTESDGSGSGSGPGSNGSGTGSGSIGAGSDGAPGGIGGNTDAVTCVQGDKVNFNPGGEAGACIESGKTYNFNSSECMDMRKADFDCTWDGLFEGMKAIGLDPTAKLQEYRAQGGKMITCGQAAGKSPIVAQILIPPAGEEFQCIDGKVVNGKALTGCYTSEPNNVGPGEQDAFVYGCISKTND